MHGRLAHRAEPLSYAQPRAFTLWGSVWPMWGTLFLKSYFLVFKSMDMNSLRTRFRIELRHTSFLMLHILFDIKGVDVHGCLYFIVSQWSMGTVICEASDGTLLNKAQAQWFHDKHVSICRNNTRYVLGCAACFHPNVHHRVMDIHRGSPVQW